MPLDLRNMREWPVVNVDGFFRYVNHDMKLATTGFSAREALERNVDILRTDRASVEAMSRRYQQMFNTSKGA